MTEAGWTRDKPTEAGWYWWRRDQHALPGVAIVCSDLSGYYMNRTGHNSTFDHVDDVIGEWLGPISPTDRQQGRVAAFKEVEQRFDSVFGATDRRIDSVRDYRIDKFFTWLAQQAQEEKGVGDVHG